METGFTHDVAVIGGSAAGLSAAVTLARSLRSVVVVDAGDPRNAPAEGAHNVLGHDGVSPLELLAMGRREAEHYGAELRRDEAVAARVAGQGLEVELASGATLRPRRLLLATGLVDELPDVPGVREFWGSSVLHCAYCHGWEVRGKHIGVLGTSALSVHQTLLFRQLSKDVTLFRHTMPEPDEEQRQQIAALGVRVVDGVVDHLRGSGGVLRSVVLTDGSEFAVEAVTVAPRFIARAGLYEQLAGTLAQHPMGEFIPTGAMGRTDMPVPRRCVDSGERHFFAPRTRRSVMPRCLEAPRVLGHHSRPNAPRRSSKRSRARSAVWFAPRRCSVCAIWTPMRYGASSRLSTVRWNARRHRGRATR